MNKETSIRKDWNLIESLITPNSRVLDIGCGEGGLITQLEKNIDAKTNGIEINPELVRKAIARGHNVVQGNAELDLQQYSKQSYDYVILSQTLQAMLKPKDVLLELLRIGKKAIVSFPNFGHWKIRLQLLFTGKMPVTKGLPYQWYETPNIHFFTIKDFENLCKESNIVIESRIALNNQGVQLQSSPTFSGANLLTNEAIFLLSFQNFEPIKIQSNQKTFIKNSVIAN
jgi:methionine biosynthesis protein MetW